MNTHFLVLIFETWIWCEKTKEQGWETTNLPTDVQLFFQSMFLFSQCEIASNCFSIAACRRSNITTSNTDTETSGAIASTNTDMLYHVIVFRYFSYKSELVDMFCMFSISVLAERVFLKTLCSFFIRVYLDLNLALLFAPPKRDSKLLQKVALCKLFERNTTHRIEDILKFYNPPISLYVFIDL